MASAVAPASSSVVVGLQQDRAFDPDRERVLELLDGGVGPEREHPRSRSAFHQPDGLGPLRRDQGRLGPEPLSRRRRRGRLQDALAESDQCDPDDDLSWKGEDSDRGCHRRGRTGEKARPHTKVSTCSVPRGGGLRDYQVGSQGFLAARWACLRDRGEGDGGWRTVVPQARWPVSTETCEGRAARRGSACEGSTSTCTVHRPGPRRVPRPRRRRSARQGLRDCVRRSNGRARDSSGSTRTHHKWLDYLFEQLRGGRGE